MVSEPTTTRTKVTMREPLTKAFRMDMEDLLMRKGIFTREAFGLEEEMVLEYTKINRSHIVGNSKTTKSTGKESRKHPQHTTRDYLNMIKNPQASSNISLRHTKANLLTIPLTAKESSPMKKVFILANLKMEFKTDMASFLGRMVLFTEEILRMVFGKDKGSTLTLKTAQSQRGFGRREC